MKKVCVVLLASVMVSASCGKDTAASAEQPGAETSAESTAATHDSHQPATAAAPAAAPSDGLSEELRNDLAMMEKASGTEAAAQLGTHRQLVANLIATSNAEMRGMNMPMDAAWTATVDSLRRDLVSLAAQSPGGLPSVVRPHVGRVRRLALMHASMMATMKH